ncbi:MAG: peroxiredoxin [Alphaproteobacteria bacterium]|nr:peroxiredoxin [Alphaproteobacteria bacterium]
MTIQVGDRIPEATLRMMTDDGIVEMSTGDVFGGKKVAFFGVPGAFTPTCSAKHLPGFVRQADALKGKGVDAIACLAWNDPFVMGAWGTAQSVGDKVMMLADGNGELTTAMGLAFDASGHGLGKRNRRFSMVVDDGVVSALNLEDGGAFEVSSAEHLLKQL